MDVPVVRDGPPRVLFANVTVHLDNLKHLIVLTDLDYDVKVIGQFGLETAPGPYDLIVQMGLGEDGPGKRLGLGFLDSLRRKFPEAPILVVSSHPESYGRDEALAHGADDYLYRPGALNQPAQFIYRVNTLIGSTHQPR